MSLVRHDGSTMFIRTGGYEFVPGDQPGYGHAYDMSDGGSVVGQHVKARHLAGSSLARVQTPQGTRYWFSRGSYMETERG